MREEQRVGTKTPIRVVRKTVVKRTVATGPAPSAVRGPSSRNALKVVGSLRLPRPGATSASAVAGAIAALLATGITVLASTMFSYVRGVGVGGKGWGSLAILLIVAGAFMVGDLLLRLMGVRQPRLTSFLGWTIALILLMTLFLGPVHSAWAWLIMPLLGGAAFAVAHRLLLSGDAARAPG